MNSLRLFWVWDRDYVELSQSQYDVSKELSETIFELNDSKSLKCHCFTKAFLAEGMAEDRIGIVLQANVLVLRPHELPFYCVLE